MGKRLSFEYVKQYFTDNNCELLEEVYVNCMIKMKYKCKCGEISNISLDNFKKGQRCWKCRNNKIANKLKLNFEDVYTYFKKYNCKLLEREYVNSNTKMKYQCVCGNFSEISFSSFKQGKRCKKCAKNEKFNFEYIYNYFKSQKCELIEKDYKNNHTKMKYRCSCGNISKICFNNFRIGNRCNKCGSQRSSKKRSGENSHFYNPNLKNEDRISRRLISGYNAWRKSIYKKNSYVCVLCGNKKNIQAHHIDGYAENENLRFSKENGVTLCRSCHNKFHSRYGKINVNRQQFNEFIMLGVK